MTSRRSFLAKIFSSAIAAPAVAGIIERGISKPLPDAKCVGVTGAMGMSQDEWVANVRLFHPDWMKAPYPHNMGDCIRPNYFK